MKKTIVTVLISLILLSSGCAQYWYQEGKTFEQCQKDRDMCFGELQKRSDLRNPTAQYEIEYMDNCMKEKGYRSIKGSELPLDARRQEPDSSLHWRARGLAGSVK